MRSRGFTSRKACARSAHRSAATMRGTISSGGFELAYSVEGPGTPAIVIGSAVYYPRVFSKELWQSLQLIFLDHRGFAKAPENLQP